ncbi:DUF805 domain-containing protein [Fluviispira vulneris]|uniref:DUF805 domain-containing protein n=1 Tax=Fluviispira vulneris TaxID=2763012 RepID=UPI0016473FF9|nr:DUF805 domain-containing protein [Fluviispira vulneris]
MNFIKSIKICLGKYASFKGRASVSEFWYFILFYYAITLIPILLVLIIGKNERDILLILIFSVVGAFGLLPPYISVSVRRLHDMNKSGWWYFVYLIPYIGFFIFIIMSSLPGTKGKNRYDPIEDKSSIEVQ